MQVFIVTDKKNNITEAIARLGMRVHHNFATACNN